MKWSQWKVSTKIAAMVLGLFLMSAMTLFMAQQTLTRRSFHAILANLQEQAVEQHRQVARDLMKEVKTATEGSLQRGEYVQFTRFAKQQQELAQIRAFSFINKNLEVELSSDSARVGRLLAQNVWEQARRNRDTFAVETEDVLSLYYPLRVDADMRRLNPTSSVGDLYGVLHLEFSKDQVREMLASAKNTFEASSWKNSCVALAMTVAASILSSIAAVWLCRLLLRPLQRCIQEMQRLADATVHGKLQTRGNPELVGHEFRPIVDGANDTLDAVIGPLNVAAKYVDDISKGNIPAKITDSYNGDFNTIKNNLNQCIDAVNAMTADAVMLAKAGVQGKLATRADASKHQGDFRKIVQGVNDTLDAVINPLNVAAEYVDR
ncbi:MAG: hypothetical protein WCJ35_26465, partial [Planctomycetota bacterium]